MFIVNALHRAALVRGRHLASVHGERRCTWLELRERVARLAAVLRAAGAAPGARVALLGWNSDRYLEAVLGVPWAGAVLVPLNTRLAPAEIAWQVQHAQAELLLFDAGFEAVAAAAREARPGLRLLALGDPNGTLDVAGTEPLLAASSGMPDANPRPEDTMGIFYTGGTTGLPKGVTTPHAAFAHQTLLHSMDLGWDPDTVYLHVLPMFHLGGLAAAYCLSSLGGTHRYMEKFDPEACLGRLAAERITAVALSPVSIGAMLDSPRLPELDLSALRHVGYGTAPITETILRRAMQRLPGARFTQIYGQTEITGTISVLRPDHHELDGPRAARLRSAGQPSWGVQVRIVDEHGANVPAGAHGEVLARSPGVMSGYWRDPDQTAATLREGWLHTGDVGYLDEDGFLFIVDRIKDMIVSGGENVFCGEVENAIAACPGVAQVSVFGVPHPQWGEAVHAVVVPADGAALEADTVIAHCRSLIAGYKCPRSIEFHPGPLPLSGVNKIRKHVLREPHWRGYARRVN